MKKLSPAQVIRLVNLAVTFDYWSEQSRVSQFLEEVEKQLGVRLTGPQWATTGRMSERLREEVKLFARHLVELTPQPVPSAHNDNIPRRFRKDIDD